MRKEYTYTASEQITLRNDYHNTEVNMRPRNGRLTKGQIDIAKRQLCGVKGCACGDAMGCRGKQAVRIEIIIDRAGNVAGAYIYPLN